MTTFRSSRPARLLYAYVVLAIASCAAHAQAPSTTQAQLAIEPKAIDILKASCARLAAAHSIEFTSVETFENPSRVGYPLAYGTKSDVLLKRPDKLRVVTSGDGPASEFYYDGKVMMALSPAENLIAIADAPPTVDGMLGTAYHSAAIYFAFDDMIVSDPYKDIAEGMNVAFYVGQSKIVGGVTTDIVAYESGGVFIQVWIGADDKLPRLIRAIYADDPNQARHTLVLTNWQLDEKVPADAFGTAKAKSAKRIPFAAPNAPAGSFQPKAAVQPAKTSTTNE
jgi:hypothetical protein